MPEMMREPTPASGFPEKRAESGQTASAEAPAVDIQDGFVSACAPGGETTVGQRLRFLRGTMTQRDFARLVEIHKSSLGRYERGESYPDVSDLRKLCQKLAVDPDWLLFGGDRQIYVTAKGRRKEKSCKTCDLVMKMLAEETRARQEQGQAIRALVNAVNELKAMVCSLAGHNNYSA